MEYVSCFAEKRYFKQASDRTDAEFNFCNLLISDDLYLEYIQEFSNLADLGWEFGGTVENWLNYNNGVSQAEKFERSKTVYADRVYTICRRQNGTDFCADDSGPTMTHYYPELRGEYNHGAQLLLFLRKMVACPDDGIYDWEMGETDLYDMAYCYKISFSDTTGSGVYENTNSINGNTRCYLYQ